MKIRCLLLMSMSVLAGCVSMSETECRNANAATWESIGQEDGQDGQTPERRLAQHREACAKVGVTPDRDRYLQGWSRGIVDYCTPERAYAVGLDGSSGNDAMCPGDSSRLFRLNAQLGRQVHDLKDDISRLQDEIRGMEKKLENPQLDRDARADLRAKIRHRDEELSRLRPLLVEMQMRPLVR